MMTQAHLVLPIGTQVVVRTTTNTHVAGAVARVVAIRDDDYIVRFADDSETTLTRVELSIRKHFQHALLSISKQDMLPYIIYRCIVGSRAYGLDDEGSDTDTRGIYLLPATLHWSLDGVPEQIEYKASEECYWELQKFLVLALKANPNILECLYTPLVVDAAPLAQELLTLREAFLSQLIYQTYNGYVMSQFRRLEQDMRTNGAIKWKHAMHLVRLLLSGITALREGYVPVQVGAQREQLLAIKRGEVAWDAINSWRLELHRAFDAAFAATALPERPNYQRVNDFLIHARQTMAEQDHADKTSIQAL